VGKKKKTQRCGFLGCSYVIRGASYGECPTDFFEGGKFLKFVEGLYMFDRE
jgi:hypothetical protein